MPVIRAYYWFVSLYSISTKTWGLKTTETPIDPLQILEAFLRMLTIWICSHPFLRSLGKDIETAKISFVGQRQKLLLIGSPALENLHDADLMVRFLRWSIDRFFPSFPQKSTHVRFFLQIWNMVVDRMTLSLRSRKFGSFFLLCRCLPLACLTLTKPTKACLRMK